MASLSPLHIQAARDLSAAVEAVKEGCVATAMLLALDALSSLTGEAAENEQGILLQPVETSTSMVAEVTTAEVAAVHQMCKDMLVTVGHVRYWTVKAFRERVTKKAVT